MAVSLWGECSPYRCPTTPFRNSVGSILANASGNTLDEFLSSVIPHYVCNEYVSQHARKSIFFLLSCQHRWKYLSSLLVECNILVGRRMQRIAHGTKINKPFNRLYKLDGIIFGCVPNPLADKLWNNSSVVVETGLFLEHIVEQYGDNIC